VFAIYSWTLKHNPRLLVIAALMATVSAMGLYVVLSESGSSSGSVSD